MLMDGKSSTHTYCKHWNFENNKRNCRRLCEYTYSLYNWKFIQRTFYDWHINALTHRHDTFSWNDTTIYAQYCFVSFRPFAYLIYFMNWNIKGNTRTQWHRAIHAKQSHTHFTRRACMLCYVMYVWVSECVYMNICRTIPILSAYTQRD